VNCRNLTLLYSTLLYSTLLYAIRRALHPYEACARLFGNTSPALTRTVTSTDDPSFNPTLLYAIRGALHRSDACARPFGNSSPALTRTVTSTDDPSFNPTLLYAILRALGPRASRFSDSQFSLPFDSLSLSLALSLSLSLSLVLYVTQCTLHPDVACVRVFGNASLALTHTVTFTDDLSFV
jgi:hypothetical protein